jgi:hypothetical protein
MADEPTFAEILVSQLGQPKEPFGWGDLLGLSVLAAALAAYLALELGAARLLRKLFDWLSPHPPSGDKTTPDA